jgi:LPS export ABC transporter protein LptC
VNAGRADARTGGRPALRPASRHALVLSARLGICASLVLGAACGAPDRNVAAAAGTVADSADQTMFGLSQILTKDGVKQAYLQVDTAFMYEASGRVDLRGHLKVTFYSVQGAPQSVLTGKEGTLFTRTNEMSARNDVLVVRTADQARLRTDYLQFDPARNEVRTDRPYVADKAAQHFEGVGFVCDPGFTNCTTQQAKGNAGRLVMPAR